MLVYVDARCLQDECYAFRGVGYHSSTLLRHAIDHYAGQVRLRALVDPSLPDMAQEYVELFEGIQPWSEATFVEQGSVFVQLSPMTHDQAACGRLLDRKGILSAAVIYDFIPLDVSERYLANTEALRGYASAMLWLDAYELFFPISLYSERRLLETTAAQDDNSFVTGVTLRQSFQDVMSAQRQTSPHSGSSHRLPSSINRPYFIFVGGGDPRKNAELVVTAHAKSNTETDLVIVGNYPDDRQSELKEKHRALGSKSRKIRFISGISDDKLSQLYADSIANVSSSFIEGFSLPVIEGMAAGAPTLVSDNEAHRELVANPEYRFDPNDSQALAGLMERIAGDVGFRQQVITDQRDVPGRFLSNRVGERFWQPIIRRFEQRFRSTPPSRLAVHCAQRRASLAILSPFPPDRSGIADYTRQSVLALAKYVDVDVFTDCPNPQPTPEVRAFHQISDFAYISGEYDRVLAVIGNSSFHTKIIDLQRRYGGPCLIHDNRLAELYNWWKGEDYFRQMASRMLGREVTQQESKGWIADPGTLPGIFFDELVDSANPLIVHSRGIQRQIKKQYNLDAQYLPFSCYRSFDDEQLLPSSRDLARTRLGFSDDALHVITLGIVAGSKAPKECIEAISKITRSGHRAELHFVGNSSKEERRELKHWAKSHGIANSVHFTEEWVSEEAYRDYVLAADFAIQLRTHFFGGLSGALLDCIVSGLPTVANDDLAEAMDCPDFVGRISDRLGVDELVEALGRLISEYGPKYRACDTRRDYLIRHSFDRYAVEMLRVLGLEDVAANKRTKLIA